MSEKIKSLPLAFNNSGETHLDVDFGYELGGENWYSGGHNVRGYYLYCCPVKIKDMGGYTTVTSALGKGLKVLLKEVTRKSKKAEAEAREQAEKEMPKLISSVLRKYGLKLQKRRMSIAVYQINRERDAERVKFMSLDFMTSTNWGPGLYDKVFEGEVEADNLQEVYFMFNRDDRPGAKRFHSLSVSDVVEVKNEEGSKFYFCDTIGFNEIAFDSSSTTDAAPGRISVLYVEPGKTARMLDVERELDAYQRICETDTIQAIYPFADRSVVLVCDDEGKLKHATNNRALYDEDGNIVDVLCGPFFMCRQNSDGEWVSLTPEQQEMYMSLYREPKRFEMWGKIIHEEGL